MPFELPGSPGRTFYENAGKSSRTGIETALSWTGSSGFGVDASLTWSDFKFDEFVADNGPDFSGSRMPGVPEIFAWLKLNYENNGFTAYRNIVFCKRLGCGDDASLNADIN